MLLFLLFTQRGNRLISEAKEFILGPRLPEGYVYGIDVSHFQGDIEWEKVTHIAYDPIVNRVRKDGTLKKKIRFAIVKATEGSSNHYDDENYYINRAEIKRKGLVFGAYHVLTSGGKVEEQAKRYIEVTRLEKGDIRPILDVENDIKLKGRELIDAIKSWIRIVENHYKCKPIIYTSYNLYKRALNIDEFKEYDFWIAQYNNMTIDVDCAIWQFSHCGKIEGISGRVDLNVLPN
ncbi:MAG: GH25 family lysozyme, partial [Bacteroidia bacterium]|nr:GH25 family lysozyme [Bacteroidia bacterium]